MAAIDKYYVNNWEDYSEIAEWAKNTDMVYPNGENVGRWSQFLTECEPGDFSNHKWIPIANTVLAQDWFLYHNCPIKLIQDALKEKYKNEVPCIRTVEKFPCKIHFKMPRKIFGYVGIDIENIEQYFLGYNKYDNSWYSYQEGNRIEEYYCKNLSRRKLKRLLKHWKFPKDTFIEIFGHGTFKKFKVC